MEYCFVDTKFGRIKGEKTNKGKIFKSIPYAVTERFEDPKEVDFWGEFDATVKSKNCYQRFAYYDEKTENGFYYREFDSYRVSDFVESPMTLTIKTPLNAEKCPVLIYIHGGSFNNGCIDDVPFGTSWEYPERGIIQVSVGYRLNVFGLYDTENYGLKDQVFAIKWIKENIEDFGGDCNHMILMGQSAGAMCVNDLLMDSEDLNGVIKGAIMMSGAGFIPKPFGQGTKQQNKEFWDEVKKNAGCQSNEQLKKVDAEKLWRAWYKASNEKPGAHSSMPGIDGKILKQYPTEIAKQNKDLDVPLMIGITSQDMFPFMIYDLAASIFKRNIKDNRSNIYAYFFDRNLPGNCYKAFHASDLWYMFGSFEYSFRPWEKIDYKLSKQMIDYTANFIYNLNPNGENLDYWPSINKQNKKLRLFSESDNKYISGLKCRLKLYRSWLFDKGPF